MTVSLKDIRLIEQVRYPAPTKLIIGQPLTAPVNPQATGKEGFFIIQWAAVIGAQGYRIAVMTDNNLDKPNIGLFSVYGQPVARFDYLLGNIVLTRNFAIQAFREDEYGPFTKIVSATSSLMSAAG